MPFPSPEDFPDPGIEPRPSALQADSLLSEPPKNPLTPVLFLGGLQNNSRKSLAFSAGSMLSIDVGLRSRRHG